MSRSASPRPSASLPMPTSKSALTARTMPMPKAAPARLLSRPSCHDPAGAQSGNGPQTGQTISPCGMRGNASGRIHGIVAAFAPRIDPPDGQGHGKSVERTIPTSVPA